MAKTKVSTIVSKQIPEFARADHPMFVAFVEAYYEFLDQSENRSIDTIRDIDNTLDEFVTHFKNEFDFNGMHYNNIDERFLLTHIKQIYTAKGTDAAFKLLFRLLFDKEIELYYPSTAMLRVSDGKWSQATSIFVDVTAGDPNSIINNYIKVVRSGNQSSIKTFNLYISSIKFVRNNVWEIFFERRHTTNIDLYSIVSFGGFEGIVVPTVISYSVEIPGHNFKVGQLLTITTPTDVGDAEMIVKITKVDTTGGIRNIEIITHDIGYVKDFYSIIQPNKVTVSNKLSTININTPTTEYTFLSNSSTDGHVEKGYLTNPNYWGKILDYNDFSTDDYVGELRQSFYSNITSSLDDEYKNFATIRFNLGAIGKYPGHYIANDGFVSDNFFIQDSKYYQAYSYVIKVDEQLSTYKNIVRSYLHPAGTALFGEYIMDTQVAISPTVSSTEVIGNSKLLGNFPYFYIVEQLAVTDFAYFTMYKAPVNDDINIVDSHSLTIYLNKTDTVTASDVHANNNIMIDPYSEGYYYAVDYAGDAIYF